MTDEMVGANDTCLEREGFSGADELLVEGRGVEVGVDDSVDEQLL